MKSCNFFKKLQDNKNSKESSKSTMNQALMMSVLSGGGSGDMFSSPAFLLAKAIGGKKSDDIMSSLLLSSVVGDGSAISEMKKAAKRNRATQIMGRYVNDIFGIKDGHMTKEMGNNLRDLLSFYYNNIECDYVKAFIVDSDPAIVRDRCMMLLENPDQIKESDLLLFSYFLNSLTTNLYSVDMIKNYAMLVEKFGDKNLIKPRPAYSVSEDIFDISKGISFEKSSHFTEEVEVCSGDYPLHVYVSKNDLSNLSVIIENIERLLIEARDSEFNHIKRIEKRFPTLDKNSVIQPVVKETKIVVEQIEYVVSENPCIIGGVESLEKYQSIYTYPERFGNIEIMHTLLISRTDKQPITSMEEVKDVVFDFVYIKNGFNKCLDRANVYMERIKNIKMPESK